MILNQVKQETTVVVSRIYNAMVAATMKFRTCFNIKLYRLIDLWYLSSYYSGLWVSRVYNAMVASTMKFRTCFDIKLCWINDLWYLSSYYPGLWVSRVYNAMVGFDHEVWNLI